MLYTFRGLLHFNAPPVLARCLRAENLAPSPLNLLFGLSRSRIASSFCFVTRPVLSKPMKGGKRHVELPRIISIANDFGLY